MLIEIRNFFHNRQDSPVVAVGSAVPHHGRGQEGVDEEEDPAGQDHGAAEGAEPEHDQLRQELQQPQRRRTQRLQRQDVLAVHHGKEVLDHRWYFLVHKYVIQKTEANVNKVQGLLQ